MLGSGSGCGGGAGQRAAQMQAIADASDAIGPGLGEDLRALALIHLGSAEFWVARLEEAGRHLEQGVTLAGRIGRPYLEFTALACQASFEFVRSFALAVERGRQAAELAWRHGWTDEPAVGFASIARTFGAVLVLQGRLEEAEPWSNALNVRSERKSSPSKGWRSARMPRYWSWHAAGTRTRWPPSRPPTGWPGASPNRT